MAQRDCGALSASQPTAGSQGRATAIRVATLPGATRLK